MRGTRVLAAGTLVALSAGALLAWRWNHRGPGRPSVPAAVSRFRDSTPQTESSGSWQPKAGVYLYKGTGTESLSFLGTHQRQGPVEPGTVTPLADGCWRFRMDFNSFHSQTWTRCNRNGVLVETAGTTDQKFDFFAFSTKEHTDVQCAAPISLVGLATQPGATSTLRCEQRSRTTKAVAQQHGTVTFVGRDTVEVAGKKVPALHAREVVTVSGGQTGNVSIDLWFAVANGLPLAESHSIRVVSSAPAPINHVTYTEKGSWRIQSLVAKT